MTRDLRNTIANSVSGLANLWLALENEYLQQRVIDGQIPYEIYMGYLSDFGASSAMCSGLLLLARYANVPDMMRRMVPIGLGLGNTLREFFPLHSNPTFDPWDIPVYWAGIAVAVGVDVLSKKRNQEGIEARIDTT